MANYDFDFEPMGDAIRRAREEGRKRVTIGGYPVSIYPNHAIFHLKNGKQVKARKDKTNRQKGST